MSWPDCTVTPGPAGDVLSLANCGNGNVCGVCDGCLTGPCFDTACAGLSCDPYSGECIDLCAGVVCPEDQRCDASTGGCISRLGGMCTSCQFNADCGAGGANLCLVNPLNDAEHFCTRSCGHQACPAGFVCASEGNAFAACLPAIGACTDACEDSACSGFFCELCDSVSGSCLLSEPCHYHRDCPAGAYCNTSSFECVNTGAGQSPLGGACESSAGCVAGLACRLEAQVCVQPCDNSSTCPAGQICRFSGDLQLRYCGP